MEHFFEALNKLDHTFCSKVMKLLKGKTEKSGAFRQKHEGYRIHCANCVLEFDFAAMDWVSRPFAPEDYSRKMNRMQKFCNCIWANVCWATTPRSDFF